MLKERDHASWLTTVERPYSSPVHSGELRLGTVQRQVRLRLGDAMLHSAGTLHTPDRRTLANAGAARMDEVGVYLTDGVFLYRVVDQVVTAAGEMIDVEDCYWLDVVRGCRERPGRSPPPSRDASLNQR